jgi:peptidoglycan/xylan/chitin deacetylase (PgdA/CDA1 family)
MKYNIPGRRQWLTISVLTALAVPLMAPETMAQSTAETAAKNPVSAVAIMYHRFGEDAHPSTNIKLEQFDAHLAELSSGKYAVLPLPEIVAALRSGTPLPDRAVAITIDDAYRSVYTEAWPRLRKAGLPFTLFVATQPVEQGLPGFMTWDQIRELRDAGVTIGAHTHTHAHLAKGSLAAAKAEIDTSTVILKRELGVVQPLFAYPFGETSAEVTALVRTAGHSSAFGQHSGVMEPGQSPYYLPRFALNETYGGMDRLTLVLNALPVPVTGIVPTNPLIAPSANPPAFGFTVDKSVRGLSQLACYHSQTGKATIERLGPRRIEVRFNGEFRKGRSRINCTMPGPGGRWRWLGMQYYVKP